MLVPAAVDFHRQGHVTMPWEQHYLALWRHLHGEVLSRHYTSQSSFHVVTDAFITVTENYADGLYGYCGPDVYFPSVAHPLPSSDYPEISSFLHRQSPEAQFWPGSVFSTVQRADWNYPLVRMLGKIRLFQGKIQTHSSARSSHPPNDGYVIWGLNLFRSVSNSSVPTCVYFTFISEAHCWVPLGTRKFSFVQ